MDLNKLDSTCLQNDLRNVIDNQAFFIDHESTERYWRAADNLKEIKLRSRPIAIGNINKDEFDFSLEVIFWIDRRNDFGKNKYGKYIGVRFFYAIESLNVIYGCLFAYYDGLDPSSRMFSNVNEAIAYIKNEHIGRYNLL